MEKAKTKTGYHYACVIKDGKYHEFVIVNEFNDGTEEVYAYTLQEGEMLIKAQPPVKKVHAESDGFIAPVWNGTEWVEGATAEEIAQWNAEHPAPVVEPTADEQLRADVDYIAALTGIEL